MKVSYFPATTKDSYHRGSLREEKENLNEEWKL